MGSAQKVINSLIQETCADDPKEIANDVKVLSESLIDNEVIGRLQRTGPTIPSICYFV